MVRRSTDPDRSQLGFGTWQSEPGQVGEAVYQALKAGYRHLDLATIYQNQREVAAGIKRAYQDVPGLKREDLFITSKLWNSQHHPNDIEKALDECLDELELDYLDVCAENSSYGPVQWLTATALPHSLARRFQARLQSVPAGGEGPERSGHRQLHLHHGHLEDRDQVAQDQDPLRWGFQLYH